MHCTEQFLWEACVRQAGNGVMSIHACGGQVTDVSKLVRAEERGTGNRCSKPDF